MAVTNERLAELIGYCDPAVAYASGSPWPPLTEMREALQELQARRVADPTPAQRAWWQQQGEYMGRRATEIAAGEGGELDGWEDENAVYGFSESVRLAAHFGRLALGDRDAD